MRTMTHVLFAGFASMAIFSAQTHAHLLPVSYLFNKMIKNRAVIRTLELEGRVTDLKNQITFKETARIDFNSGRVSLVYTNEGDELLAEQSLKISSFHALGLAWYGLGMDPSPTRVDAYLEQLGVGIASEEATKLQRIEARPVWEVGGASVVQIEKDEFLFAGYRNPTENVSLRVRDFSLSDGAPLKLPKTLRFAKAGADLYEYQLKSFKLNTIKPTPPSKATSKNGSNSLVIQGWNELVH